MRRIATLLALCLAASPALAADPTPYDRAIAAGYKALMLCGAMFNGGRMQSQVEALELTGIYPEYNDLVPTLAATADVIAGTVTVPFSDTLPPRFAVWRGGQGCTIQPIGQRDIDRRTPTVTPTPGATRADDAKPWPQGDAGTINPPLPTLLPVIDKVFDGTTFGAGTRSTGFVVVHHGRIVAEHYAEGFNATTAQRTWSVAKSLTGTLVGAAVQQGKLRVDAPANIPEWGPPGIDPRRSITVDQLLRMASGLHSATAGNRTDALYFGGTAVTDEVTAWPLEVGPGTRFRYANNDIVLAMRALRANLNDDRAYNAFAPAFFAKLGMTRTVMERDWRGNYVSSSQVWSTARDLARFGLLYLADGVWNGERLLPEGWRAYVTRPTGPQPQDNRRYGATFWLFHEVPGVPDDAFSANGNRGQFVVIIPSLELVIVRRGEDPGRFDIDALTAEVVKAVQLL